MERRALLPEGSSNALAGDVASTMVSGEVTNRCQIFRPTPTGLPWEYCTIHTLTHAGEKLPKKQHFVLMSLHSFLNAERLNKTLKLRILYKDKSGMLNTIKIMKRWNGRRSASYRRLSDDFVDSCMWFEEKKRLHYSCLEIQKNWTHGIIKLPFLKRDTTLFRFVARFARVRIEESSRNRFALNSIQVITCFIFFSS